MAIDFPGSPSPGDTYVDPNSGVWTWNGTNWGGAERVAYWDLTGTTLEPHVAGDILPKTDNTDDLGSSTRRFANVFTGDLHLSNEGSTNDVDGSWGKWVIQEGEEDLFLINLRNGKTFAFVLKEIG